MCDLIAAVCGPEEFTQLARDVQCRRRYERVDRAVRGQALALLAPADSSDKWFRRESVTHRSAQTVPATFSHLEVPVIATGFELAESDSHMTGTTPADTQFPRGVRIAVDLCLDDANEGAAGRHTSSPNEIRIDQKCAHQRSIRESTRKIMQMTSENCGCQPSTQPEYGGNNSYCAVMLQLLLRLQQLIDQDVVHGVFVPFRQAQRSAVRIGVSLPQVPIVAVPSKARGWPH